MATDAVRWLWVKMAHHPRRVELSERGAGLVEYTLLMALIALVCFAALTFFGEATAEKMSIQATCFDGGCGEP